MKRTDLFYETAVSTGMLEADNVHRGTRDGTEFVEAVISPENPEMAPGRYVTLFTGKGNIKKCMTFFIGDFLTEGSVLVAGLGNENICSDSLGSKVLRYIPATAHLSGLREFGELGLRSIYVCETGVTGKTGIESGALISCVAERVGADTVIVIDSLACSDIERLCRTIQITDTGIAPGSGVGNDRQAINQTTVGVPVIAIGVPTVIDLESLECGEKSHGLMVTPRNIDVLIRELAETIGISVSMALNPGLSEEEIRSLLII